MSERAIVGEASVPRLARGTRLQFDKHRDQWIVQAPERVFVLDPIAHEIVQAGVILTLPVILFALQRYWVFPRSAPPLSLPARLWS